MCQCPASGFFHFYEIMVAQSLLCGICVNALHRASFISTGQTVAGSHKIMCQCPISGFFHFYSLVTNYRRHFNKLCQCPTSGLFHFYQVGIYVKGGKTYLCQCPSSGFFHFYPFHSGILYLCGFPVSFLQIIV